MFARACYVPTKSMFLALVLQFDKKKVFLKIDYLKDNFSPEPPPVKNTHQNQTIDIEK